MVRRLSLPQIIYTPMAVLIVSIFVASNPLAFVTVGNAQSELCTSNVQAAVAATGSLCDGTPGNNACYGHSLVDADVREMPEETFDQPGDRVELTLIDSLRLSAMNIEEGTWGVAQMHLKAPATASTLQSVNMLLFGDVSLTNTAERQINIEATTVDIGENINVRALPNTASYVSVALEPDTIVTATGRTEDASWVRVELADSGYTGWVTANLLTSEEDLSDLSVITSNDTYYGPLQAYYFSSSSGELDCGNLPVDGLILQTPEGPAQVKIFINEVSIDLLPSSTGNTLFLEAQAAGDMTISVLEGSAYVGANGTGEVAVAGSQVSVSLNADLSPNGAVTPAKPYAENRFPLMASYFPNQPVTIASPATEDQITQGNVFAQAMRADMETESLGESLNNEPSTTAVSPGAPASQNSDNDDDDDDNSSSNPPTNTDANAPNNNNSGGNSNQGNDNNGNNNQGDDDNDDGDQDDDDNDDGDRGNNGNQGNRPDGGVNPGGQDNGTPIEIDTTTDTTAPEQSIVIDVAN